MLNSTRKRETNPPNYGDLERNSIPQLLQILSVLGVVPPSTSDRDELIQLIKLKITPRKSQRRKMYQKAAVDDDSPVNNNFTGSNDFNVSNDQYDEIPNTNENNDISQNNNDLIQNDESASFGDSIFDNELSNSAFYADSSSFASKRPSSKLFPSNDQSKADNEDDLSQYQSQPDRNDSFGWGSSSESDSNGWGSSSSGTNSRSSSPQLRIRIKPPKQKTPTNISNSHVSTSPSKSNTEKYVYRKKHQEESFLSQIPLKWLLIVFFLLLLLYFFLLALIPLPDESKYLPNCPKEGHCNHKREGNETRYHLYRCNDNYEPLTNGLIQICAPIGDPIFNEYKSTLDAAAYISKANGDCFFNNEKIDLQYIQKNFPQANPKLLITDEDFLTELNGDEFKSLLPNYESTCRAFRACDNSPILTGFIVLLAFIASYLIVKHFFSK